ncbi:hypothetical protein Tco_0328016 [Tanacetum coccineum]
MIRGCYFTPKERRDHFHHFINCYWDFVMESLDEFKVYDSMHESEYSHAFWCSFDMPTFKFISFHKIFRRLCITLLDVMEFYRIFDVLLLLKDRSSSSLLDLFSLDFDFQCQPLLSSLSESASVYFKWENWLRLSKHADTLRPLPPNLLNTPPSFFFEFCLGDLDRSRLILENTLRLGLGLWERLDRCPLRVSWYSSSLTQNTVMFQSTSQS